jgi:hypothetical protein
LDEWKYILQLAHQWKFDEVKNLVIRELEKMVFSPVDRIELYHRYEVDKRHLIQYYATIITRNEPVDKYEGLKLGLETVLMIAAARERVRSRPSSGFFSPLPSGVTDNDVDLVIKEVFEIPAPSSESNGKDNNGESSSQNSTGEWAVWSFIVLFD